jgi:hypothetical protein
MLASGTEGGGGSGWWQTPGADNPLFPASGPANGSFNGLHPKSNFLAVENASRLARKAQAQARKQKLDEILASNDYKLWEASLDVETGLSRIKMGQRTLDHEDAVGRESGVANLSARHKAGEDIVAGKRLVENAFITYQKLGGKATGPKDVHAGRDPAADYR